MAEQKPSPPTPITGGTPPTPDLVGATHIPPTPWPEPEKPSGTEAQITASGGIRPDASTGN